jgi:hypothetical protein
LSSDLQAANTNSNININTNNNYNNQIPMENISPLTAQPAVAAAAASPASPAVAAPDPIKIESKLT